MTAKKRGEPRPLTRIPKCERVAQATRLCRRATGPTEGKGCRSCHIRTIPGGHPLPFRAASRLAAQAGRLCYPSAAAPLLPSAGLTNHFSK